MRADDRFTVAAVAAAHPQLDFGDPLTFPATDHAALVEATRLGSARLPVAVLQAAQLLQAGRLEPSHPWPMALVLRRLRELGGDVSAFAVDGVVAPLLDAPGAAQVVRRVEEAWRREEGRDGDGRVRQLRRVADLLARWEIRPWLSPRAIPGGVVSVEELRAAARWHAALGHPAPCARIGSPEVRRRRYAARIGLPAPSGKGRRRGVRNEAREARLLDLERRVLGLPPEVDRAEMVLGWGRDRALVAEHAARHRLSYATARADWREVERKLVGAGLVPYLNPSWGAESEAEFRREQRRVDRLLRRVGLQGF